jgi:sigma-E factor negative regulatory protein RseA
MEKISALMDGELEDQEARQLLTRLKQDEELVRGWHAFHVIGDALRGERALSQEFGQRLTSRLTSEPTVLAPRPARTTKRFTAYALSAAASLSAVALVGWLAFFNNPLAPQPELASAPTSPPAAALAPSAQLASVPSEGEMNEYLIAHQEFSPSTAIQGLAPYIRGVSSTQQVKGR